MTILTKETTKINIQYKIPKKKSKIHFSKDIY